jgi:S-adenosylmethionine:tRNA ribosyltransferase-isomerase
MSAGPPVPDLDDYDFELPPESIAQQPAAERDSSRLLRVERDSGQVLEPEADHRVRDLARWLRPGDLLVVNATRVLSARLRGHKSTGGGAEALLLGPLGTPETGLQRALVKISGRLRPGLRFDFGRDAPLPAELVELREGGEAVLRFEPGSDPYAHGEAPLPPYIRRAGADQSEARRDSDLGRYQTVYARVPGAVAAPTAGLHLTEPLLDELRAGGVGIAEVVLHVGPGTFRPIGPEELASGRLHSEAYELPEATAEAIARVRSEGGRVIAVGTTSARVLEACAADAGEVAPGEGTTDLFLRPGSRIRVVDGLLTNFHLPRSSLLLLVAAFVGREPVLSAYDHAIARGYRFYSYGDAMLIL